MPTTPLRRIQLQRHGLRLEYATIVWNVGEADDYEDLKENGSGLALFPIGDPPIGVWDVYEGKLH